MEAEDKLAALTMPYARALAVRHPLEAGVDT
ncbi:hypothetical protein QFZ97_002473 [Paraburkholderia youngii]